MPRRRLAQALGSSDEDEMQQQEPLPDRAASKASRVTQRCKYIQDSARVGRDNEDEDEEDGDEDDGDDSGGSGNEDEEDADEDDGDDESEGDDDEGGDDDDYSHADAFACIRDVERQRQEREELGFMQGLSEEDDEGGNLAQDGEDFEEGCGDDGGDTLSGDGDEDSWTIPMMDMDMRDEEKDAKAQEKRARAEKKLNQHPDCCNNVERTLRVMVDFEKDVQVCCASSCCASVLGAPSTY